MKTLFALIFIGISLAVGAVEGNPVADLQSIVTFGNARFTVITPSLIRMEWSQNNHFEDRASLTFLNRKLPISRFSITQKGRNLALKTTELSLTYKNDGKPFNASNLRISFLVNGKKTTWIPNQKDSLNLKGTIRTLDMKRNIVPQDLEDGILSRSGWAVVDDSRQNLFDGKNPDWVISRSDSTVQDWYFFGYGHRYKEALADFTQLAGKIPMPPKFAFGYWYSRYFCYSDTEIKDLVGDMQRYDVPADVFIVDMDWHNTYGINSIKGNMLGWTGYTWNKNLFPAPSDFLSWMHTQHLKVSLNLHPADGIYQKESCFVDFAKALGKDTTGIVRFPYNMENKEWAKSYFGSVMRPLEKQGVDFWWLDWQQWKMSKSVKNLSNTFWLNHTFFSDMEKHSDKRPMLFHRWGGMGNHRYQIGFSGDAFATFEMLSAQTYFTATASNVGYGYWSHDIGGHIQEYGATNPEIYLRWIQFGVFSPILRTHGSRQGDIERRIWKFPNFAEMNDALHLRYTLAPYIYTASRQAYDSGISICRPMYYDYAENDTAYQVPHQYMFGNDILVAPVAQAVDSNALAPQTVWLPKGQWYDMSSGRLIDVNGYLTQSYTSDEIPWFAKAGSILPANPRVNNLQQDPHHLVLIVVPGSDGESLLYEDQGDSKGYQNNEFAQTKISQKRKNNQISITIVPRTGTYVGMSDERKYTFRILGSLPAKSVMVNGVILSFTNAQSENGWTYDAANTETVISIPSIACKTAIHLEIETQTTNDILWTNGLKSSFNRMKRVAFEVKSTISKNDWARSPSNVFLQLSQTPSIVNAHPSDAQNQFLYYKKNIESALDELVKEYSFPKNQVDKYRKWLEIR